MTRRWGRNRKTTRTEKRPQNNSVFDMRVGCKYEVHLSLGDSPSTLFIVSVFDAALGTFLYRFTYPAGGYQEAREKMLVLSALS